VAWNRGCELLYGGLTALPHERRNILWLTFTSAEVREISENREEEASHALALFRTQVGEGTWTRTSSPWSATGGGQ
jgi:hypothetical protein